jgi:hypothetical protein
MTSCQLPHKIRQLLTKTHTPFVQSGPSLIAGKGVFALTTIEKDQVVALYPGIYTPPLPRFLATPLDDCSVMSYYLANKVSPTGSAVEENAYILNLQLVGGYLDGESLTKGRPLDANPSACGHLINHSPTLSNVDFESFVWSDMILAADDELYQIPNERRQDGTPWYLEGERIIRFPSPENSIEENFHTVCGAAFVTRRQIDEGEELFLNYRLRKPFPTWAQDWYTEDA